MRGSGSGQVRHPPGAVWAFITQIDNWSKWFGDSMQDVRLTSSGDLSHDSTFAYTYIRGGRSTPFTGRVTEFEPETRLTILNYAQTYGVAESIDLAPVDGGTRVTMSMEFKPTALWLRLLALAARPVAGLFLGRQLRDNVVALDRALADS